MDERWHGMTQVQFANYAVARWEEIGRIEWVLSEAWCGRDWSDAPIVRDWLGETL